MSKLIRLLLVEDTRIAQVIIKLHMSKEGCRVDVASDGASAIEKANKNPYDLILMDIGLGAGADGFEVTSKIKSQSSFNKNTPVIAISAHGEPEYMEKAKTVGIERYFIKPFTPIHAKKVIEYYKNTQQDEKLVLDRKPPFFR